MFTTEIKTQAQNELNVVSHRGQCWGPLLFIIYTNDLPDSLNGAKSILFADDTTIYISSNNISNLYRDMNIELDNLTDWFRANKLSLNVTKTNYMIFTNTNTEQRHMELTMTNKTINPNKMRKIPRRAH